MKEVYSHSQSIEIFIRLVAKVENLPLEAFRDPSLINKRVEKYVYKERYNNLLKNVFEKELDSNTSPEATIEQTESIYKFVSANFHMKLHEWKSDHIAKVKSQLGDISFLDKAMIELPTFALGPKHEYFAYSEWYAFFPDRFFYNDGLEEVTLEGLSKAIIKFHFIDKVELIRINPLRNETIKYSGTFKIIGDANVILYLEPEELSHDLIIMTLPVPKSSLRDTSSGFINETSQSSYSRRCVIKRIDDKKTKTTPIFYRTEEKEKVINNRKSGVPVKLWKYLIEESSSVQAKAEIDFFYDVKNSKGKNPYLKGIKDIKSLHYYLCLLCISKSEIPRSGISGEIIQSVYSGRNLDELGLWGKEKLKQNTDSTFVLDASFLRAINTVDNLNSEHNVFLDKLQKLLNIDITSVKDVKNEFQEKIVFLATVSPDIERLLENAQLEHEVTNEISGNLKYYQNSIKKAAKKNSRRNKITQVRHLINSVGLWLLGNRK